MTDLKHQLEFQRRYISELKDKGVARSRIIDDGTRRIEVLRRMLDDAVRRADTLAADNALLRPEVAHLRAENAGLRAAPRRSATTRSRPGRGDRYDGP